MSQKSTKKTAASKSQPLSASSKKAKRSEEEQLRESLREKEELYLRTLAEFDNYRKRVAKEGDAAAKASVRTLLLEMLDVQDSFERAFQSEALRNQVQVYQGVRSIQRQVHQLLEKRGVMSFESAGQKFDPTLHEAVDAEPSHRFAEGIVSREVQKGYVWKGKVLRLAKVVVVRNSPKTRIER